MADNFLNSGASRSVLLDALMDKQNRRYSQEQNPSSIGEALTRTGTRLVDAYSQKKLVDDELERRQKQQSVDREAYETAFSSIPSFQNPDAVAGATPQGDQNFVSQPVYSQNPYNLDASGNPVQLGMSVDPNQSTLVDAIVGGSDQAYRQAMNTKGLSNEAYANLYNKRAAAKALKQSQAETERIRLADNAEYRDRKEFESAIRVGEELSAEERALLLARTPEAILNDMTETQGKAQAFARNYALGLAQMDSVLAEEGALEKITEASEVLEVALRGNSPETTVGQWLNSLGDETVRSFYTAALNTTGASLRFESGAAIRIEEVADELLKTIPLIGDDARTLRFKQAQRTSRLRGLIGASGGVYQALIQSELNSPDSSVQRVNLPPTGALDTGSRLQDGSRIYQYANGQTVVASPFDVETFDVSSFPLTPDVSLATLETALGRVLTADEIDILEARAKGMY
jgi:hypothetical protein